MAKQAKVLTDADVKRILAVAAQDRHAPRNRCAFMISTLAGLRAIEIASLKIGSVLGSDGHVADRITFTKNQTKGGKPRSVPVSKRLAKELTTYLKSLHRTAPEAPLFTSQKGGGFTAHGIVVLLQRLYKAAGVDGASSHSGRRTFATNLAEQGVGVFVLKELLGHASIQTTSVYVDAGEHQQRNAVELL
jgi:integrase/recombinase XerD